MSEPIIDLSDNLTDAHLQSVNDLVSKFGEMCMTRCNLSNMTNEQTNMFMWELITRVMYCHAHGVAPLAGVDISDVLDDMKDSVMSMHTQINEKLN